MEECPSYSHKTRAKANADAEAPAAEKRVKKSVVAGGATTKKKSEIRKFADTFVSEDAENVKSYILQDVIIPAAKRILDDVIVGSLRMFLYGERGVPGDGRRTNASKVSYRSYYERESDRRRDNGGSRVKSGFEYDDIEFEYRGDAEAVLTEMENIIEQFDMVSVGDLYDLADISTSNYAVNRYGWTNLATATIARTRNGKYIIKLPRAVPLN